MKKLGFLRVGFIFTAGFEIVPGIVRQFRGLNPEVELSLRSIPTATQLRMLETGSLDIGFLRLPIGEHPALEVRPVRQEPFVLVVPRSHQLAKKKRVRLREVSGENLVMYKRSYAPGFHDLILGMLGGAGIVPSILCFFLQSMSAPSLTYGELDLRRGTDDHLVHINIGRTITVPPAGRRWAAGRDRQAPEDAGDACAAHSRRPSQSFRRHAICAC
jgi:hypothetical protein